MKMRIMFETEWRGSPYFSVFVDEGKVFAMTETAWTMEDGSQERSVTDGGDIKKNLERLGFPDDVVKEILEVMRNGLPYDEELEGFGFFKDFSDGSLSIMEVKRMAT